MQLKSIFNFFPAFFTSMLLAQPLPKLCGQDCHTSFGQVIGQAGKTKAYSNCHDACVSDEWHQVSVKNHKQKVPTGLKWQCVEYARRWLVENRSLSFAEVKFAYQIWDLKEAVEIATDQKRAFQHFENKKTTRFPQVGDLLIYDASFTETGHVAVVIGIDKDTILVGEQNYFNRPWEGKQYARRLLVEKSKTGKFWVLDVGLIGWMRVDK
jgi:glutathionylspermidine amidase/synthetase